MFFRRFLSIGAFLLILGNLSGCQSIKEKDLGLNSVPIPEITPKLADPATLRTLERELYQAVNQYRSSRQLPPLTLSPAVSRQARLYSEKIAIQKTETAENSLKESVKNLSLSLKIAEAAQNIAINSGYPNPVPVALQGWLEKTMNRQYLEGDYNMTGIGIVQNPNGEYYITQIFIKENPNLLTQQPKWDNSLEPWKNKDPYLGKKNTLGNDAYLIQLEEEIHRQVNQYRLSKNLPPLKMDARISQIARLYSQDMASGKATFSHDGFDQRVKAIGTSIRYRGAAENLAYLKGYPDLATTAVQGWINSPGHQKNMVGNYDLTGIGIAKNAEGEYYFTQLFVLGF